MAERVLRSRLAGNGSGAMPLKQLLDEHRSFDPKDVTILLTAYERVVAELGLLTPEEKERAASLVIRLAAN